MATTKPVQTLDWATSGIKVEPSSLKKSTGWVAPEKPPDTYFNWWQGLAGDWSIWLNERLFDDAATEDFIVQGVDGGAGTNVAGGDVALSGGQATGTGSSKARLRAATAGASGTGTRTPEDYLVADGSSGTLTSSKTLAITKTASGAGISVLTASGATSNAITGNASFGSGSGAGAGLGIGLVGVGASNGNGGDGVVGLGNVEGSGVRGEGGSTAGAAGVTGVGSNSDGPGVAGFGVGVYPGVDGLGGADSGSPGVRGTGGVTNGIGVLGLGVGTGPGVRGDAEFGSNGSGVVGVGEGTGHGGEFTANGSGGYAVYATGGTKAAYHAVPQNGWPTGAEGDFFVHDGIGKLSAYDGSLWECVARKRLASYNDSSALTATTATAFSNASYTIPSSTLLQAQTIRMRAWGTITDGAPAWFQIGVMFNGSEAFGVRFDATTDVIFFIDVELVVKAIGGSGEIIGGISGTVLDTSDGIGGEGCASAGTSSSISTNSNITLALGGYFSGAGGEMILHGAVFEIA